MKIYLIIHILKLPAKSGTLALKEEIQSLKDEIDAIKSVLSSSSNDIIGGLF